MTLVIYGIDNKNYEYPKEKIELLPTKNEESPIKISKPKVKKTKKNINKEYLNSLKSGSGFKTLSKST